MYFTNVIHYPILLINQIFAIEDLHILYGHILYGHILDDDLLDTPL